MLWKHVKEANSLAEGIRLASQIFFSLLQYESSAFNLRCYFNLVSDWLLC